MKTFSLRFRIAARVSDAFSDFMWQQSGVLGIQECSEEAGGLFRPEAEFEVLEFGTAAAEKCAEWLRRGDFKGSGSLIMEIHFEKEAWSEEDTRALERALALKKIRSEFLSCQELAPTDYLAAYQSSVRGQSIGKNLWVGPPWDQAPVGRRAIVVEPALAFGTGEHPTTQLCLERLEELQGLLRPRRILDVGTGTGVLSLAARMFFPQARIVATDLDPLCEESFAKTFALNQLSLAGIQTFFGAASELGKIKSEGPFDLIISNIYAEVLAMLAPSIKGLMAPRAKWILSGVLEGPSEKILEKAIDPDFLCQLRRSRARMAAPDFPEKENWVFMELETRQ